MRERPLEWEAWSPNERIRFAQANGRIRIKVPGHDGWPRESGWSVLINQNIDATVRHMLREIGWTEAG
jgi:hypothetical protein